VAVHTLAARPCNHQAAREAGALHALARPNPLEPPPQRLLPAPSKAVVAIVRVKVEARNRPEAGRPRP